VAQYFYDNAFFFDYVQKCRNAGITVPIIPGIMPVYSVKMTRMLSQVCGSTITADLQNRIDSLDADDPDAVLQMGIDFATAQCQALLKEGVPGLHFYTMDRSHSTTQILKNLNLCG
jgi:methylenetetrahydrofolate reductase (NADPH)